MKVIVMAIKPKYATAIYEGKKEWEFRTVPPPIGKEVYLYESAPVSAITGVVKFDEEITAINGVSAYLSARLVRDKPGVSLDEIDKYAGGKKLTALRVGKIERFTQQVKWPINTRPPMNWGEYYIAI